MTIRRFGKIVLAVLSVIPILYMLFFMGFILTTIAASFTDNGRHRTAFDFFPILLIMHFTVMLLSVALIAFYIVYLFKTDRVERDKKALWAISLFMGGPIAMPVFWYLNVWREPAPCAPGSVELRAQDASSDTR